MKKRDARIIALELVAELATDNLRLGSLPIRNYPPRDQYKIMDEVEQIVGALHDRADKMKATDQMKWDRAS